MLAARAKGAPRGLHPVKADLDMIFPVSFTSLTPDEQVEQGGAPSSCPRSAASPMHAVKSFCLTAVVGVRWTKNGHTLLQLHSSGLTA